MIPSSAFLFHFIPKMLVMLELVLEVNNRLDEGEQTEDLF